MTGNTYHIADSLFKSGQLKNVLVSQLEDAIAQHPFFGICHYLLSQKLFSEKDEKFLDKTTNTALYFTNPLWLQWLLENAVDEKYSEQSKPITEEIKKITSAKDLASDVGEATKDDLQPGTAAKQGLSAVKDELLFLPYHTVDYFASQGIRFIAEESSPDDKLGQQLKSFTQWLKTMKKLPQHIDEKNIGPAEQAAIEGIAAYSVQQKEIVTEAMADVLVKQGKNEDAIVLYQKLSLLNPSKSAYFASKIEQLNSH